MQRLKAMVTAGTRGIGAAICERLRADGIDVFTFSRTAGNFKADILNLHDRCDAMQVCGPVDILINNAGGGGRWGDPDPAKTLPDVWTDVYEKNTAAMADFMVWALPTMVKRGWGRVITIGSIHALETGGRPWFAAAKAAQIGMMGAFARDKRYTRAGITFNTILPGNVRTEGKPEVDMSNSPLGRMLEPWEVANLVSFMVKEDASALNGAVIALDGGERSSFM